MREIKFRAWGKISGRMLWVSSMDFDYDSGVITEINVHEDGEPTFSIPNFNCELMQFTNCHDINGKEVYEGDIVRGKDNYNDEREIFGIVGFQDCSFVIKNDCVTHYRWMDYTIEVVGNKFEERPKYCHECKHDGYCTTGDRDDCPIEIEKEEE